MLRDLRATKRAGYTPIILKLKQTTECISHFMIDAAGNTAPFSGLFLEGLSLKSSVINHCALCARAARSLEVGQLMEGAMIIERSKSDDLN